MTSPTRTATAAALATVAFAVAFNLVAGLLTPAPARAADERKPLAPAAAAAAEAKEPEVGEVRLRTLAPVTYCYVEVETTFNKLGESIGVAIPGIMKAADEGKIRVTGPFVLAYPQAPQGSAHLTPDKPFKVQVGLMVADVAAAVGDVKVRRTEPFKAATVLYTGPVSGIGRCYQKLFPAIERMGLKPTGEEREFTLYFEDLESPNNVVLVQVGVKEGKDAKDKGPGRPGAAGATAAAGAAAAPPKPAELKVLDRYVGTWDSRYTVKPGPGTPQEVKGTGTDVVEWVLGGRFMQVRSTSPTDGTEAIHLLTYDADRGQYRHWYFHSAGEANENSGRWDEASRAFTWKGENLKDGTASTVTDRWIDNDKRELNVLVRDGGGRVVFDMQATLTRRK